MRGISKAFFGVPALSNIDLACDAGTIHAIVGENGAGKSTLMAILAGVLAADAGEIRLDGVSVAMASSEAARRRGISVVYQEFNLIPDLSVAENVWLHREVTRWGLLARRHMRQETTQLLEEIGAADIDPETPVGRLGIAQQQLVEVARALALRPRILVMDEPTSSLAAHEQGRLLDLARRATCPRHDRALHFSPARRNLRHRRPHHRSQRRPTCDNDRYGRGDP